MTSKILIKDAIIVTMNENDDIIENGCILIENDRIKYIGNALDGGNEEDIKVIPGKDKVVIPGLINLHNHAAMTLFRSFADDLPLQEFLLNKIFPAEAKLTAEDTFWGTSLAVLEMLRGGTTTFADMYYFMDDVAQACLEGGIRASLSQGIVGLDTEVAYNSLESAKNFVKNWHNKGNGRITTMLGPHAPYTCPPEFLKKVLREADRLNAPVHIHLAETRKEMKDSLEIYNKTPVAFMKEIGLFERPVLAAHCVHLSEEDIDILTAEEVGISHNPSSNLKLGSGIAPITTLLTRKAKIGLGTDGAASNNNLDMFEEIQLSSFIQKGYFEDSTLVSAKQALEMATRGGASALNMDYLGVLKEGAKADIAILNFKKPHLHPLLDVVANIVYCASASDVETVMVDGKILVENGSCLSIDEERVYYEIKKRSARLTQF